MPTMSKLQVLQAANGKKIKIIDTIASEWMTLGDLLAFDDCSKKLNSIKQECSSVPNRCCREMFQCWIAGEGVQPCTWQKLIELISDCGEIVLAEQIKSALSSPAK